jgi:hypothetical protein
MTIKEARMWLHGTYKDGMVITEKGTFKTTQQLENGTRYLVFVTDKTDAHCYEFSDEIAVKTVSLPDKWCLVNTHVEVPDKKIYALPKAVIEYMRGSGEQGYYYPESYIMEWSFVADDCNAHIVGTVDGVQISAYPAIGFVPVCTIENGDFFYLKNTKVCVDAPGIYVVPYNWYQEEKQSDKIGHLNLFPICR